MADNRAHMDGDAIVIPFTYDRAPDLRKKAADDAGRANSKFKSVAPGLSVEADETPRKRPVAGTSPLNSVTKAPG